MKVRILVKVFLDTKANSTTSDYCQRRLNRLLHHITQRARLHDLALTLGQRALNSEQLTANLGPRQTSDLPDLIRFFRQTVLEAANTTVVFQHFRGEIEGHFLPCFNMLPDNFTANLCNLTLKAPHTRLSRVITHQITQRLGRNIQLALAQPVGLELLG